MKLFNKEDIESLESRFRANFVNSLCGYKALQLVGTKNKNGLTNLSIINSAHHLGANPPLMGYIQRPHTVEKHAYENILETKFYTFSNVIEEYKEKAHQTSAKYPREISEFDSCGFEIAQTENGTPYVGSATLVMELELRSTYEIKENSTILVVGQIQSVLVDDKFIFDDGTIDLPGLGSLAGTGLTGYSKVEKMTRYGYAKPNESLKKL